MTNTEKYKTAKEREEAFRKFCGASGCNTCPVRQSEMISCRFAWLDLEADEEKMTASKVADILEEFNRWRDGEGEYITPKDFPKVLNRAVEILRSIKE